MERKLATLQHIWDITPIPNADSIELANVLGWQVVVRKGEFKVGDLAAFFEIDSVLPVAPWSEFLVARGLRIKTIKLRGVLSQGLLIPLRVITDWWKAKALESGQPYTWFDSFEVEGTDLTELIGVTKYEPRDSGSSGDTRNRGICAWRRGPFPDFIPKTDEVRVQSEPFVLSEIEGQPYAITQKLDGQSATFYIDPQTDEFHVCSRNMSVLDNGEGARLWDIAAKYNIEGKLRCNPGYAIQGEVYGPGIQGNRLAVGDRCLAVFNVYRTHTAEFLSHTQYRAWCEDNRLPTVPEIVVGASFQYDLPALLAAADGKYPSGHDAEGIVVRPLVEQYSETLRGRLSFKVISNRYLLKTGE